MGVNEANAELTAMVQVRENGGSDQGRNSEHVEGVRFGTYFKDSQNFRLVE